MDYSENVNDLVKALLTKDEALYRTAMTSKLYSSPNEFKFTCEYVYTQLEKLGGNLDEIDDWVESIGLLFSTQEKNEVLSRAKFMHTEELLECGMKLGTDFELTPNGSIRILSQEAWKVLLKMNEKELLEWSIYYKVLRIPKREK